MRNISASLLGLSTTMALRRALVEGTDFTVTNGRVTLNETVLGSSNSTQVEVGYQFIGDLKVGAEVGSSANKPWFRRFEKRPRK